MNTAFPLTHPDGETQHYSQETLKTWIQQVKGQSGFDGLFNSEEEAQTAIDEYRTALTQDGSTVLAESVTMILEPQTSFVLIEQSTGYVKAINGGRGQKTANRTLNRATDSCGSQDRPSRSFPPLPRHWMPAARPYQLFTMTHHTLPVKKSSETGGAAITRAITRSATALPIP